MGSRARARSNVVRQCLPVRDGRSPLISESTLPSIGWLQARARPYDAGLLITLRQIHPETSESFQGKQALLLGEIGVALTHGESLPSMLHRCTDAMLRHLDAVLARIWSYEPDKQELVLQASTGDAPPETYDRVAIGRSKIGKIAERGPAFLTNDFQNDPRAGNREWAQRAGITAFAGYPLRVGTRVVGVLAVYGRNRFGHDITGALAAVAALADQVETVALLVAVDPPPLATAHEDEDLHVVEKPAHLGAAARESDDPRLAWTAPQDISGFTVWSRGSAVRLAPRQVCLVLARGMMASRGRIGKKATYARLAKLKGHSLLRVALERGNVSELRRDLARRGHPVVGDRRCGHEPTNRHFEERYLLDRPFLHLAELSFAPAHTLHHPGPVGLARRAGDGFDPG